MQDHDSPYDVLGNILSYRAEDLPWSRHIRLRVTEFLTDTPLYTIRSSKDIPEERISAALDRINPDWRNRDEIVPTPPESARQLRALCLKFNLEIMSKIGLPSHYPTQQLLDKASHSLIEVES